MKRYKVLKQKLKSARGEFFVYRFLSRMCKKAYNVALANIKKNYEIGKTYVDKYDNPNRSDYELLYLAEMLGFYSPAYQQRIESRQLLRNVKEEVISDFIYTFLLSINGTRFKVKYELVPFIKTSNKELLFILHGK